MDKGCVEWEAEESTVAIGWRMIAMLALPHVGRPYSPLPNIRSQHVGKEAEFQ